MTQTRAVAASVVILALCAAPPTRAEPPNALDGAPIDVGVIELGEKLVEQPLDEQRVAGIVVDQTVTQLGRGFSDGFATIWRSLGNTADHSLAISERPSARLGSLVTIDQGARRVYQVFLYPGRSNPRALGESAALFVQQRIAVIEAENALFSDPDVGKEADM
jgi:curli production assembly/transport component CsgE